MWLYRERIVSVVTGTAVAARGATLRDHAVRRVRACRSRWPAARRFRVVGALRESSRLRVGVHHRRHRDAGRRAHRSHAARLRGGSDARVARVRHRLVSDARAGPRRVALGRDDRRRSADAASIGPPPRSSHFFSPCRRWPPPSCTSCGKCAIIWLPSGPARSPSGFVMAFLAALDRGQTVSALRRPVRVCAVCLVSDRRGRADSGRSQARLAVMAVVAAHVSGGLLRHRAACDQRCRTGVDLRYH